MSHKKKSDGIFVERALLGSPAFFQLNGTAIKVLMRFYMKRQLHKKRARAKRADDFVITNNGKITFPYKEAERLGISRTRFTRALDMLIAYGFISIAQTGVGLCKLQTYYAISEQWRKWGTNEFKVKPRTPRCRFNGHGFKEGHPYYPKKALA